MYFQIKTPVLRYNSDSLQSSKSLSNLRFGYSSKLKQPKICVFFKTLINLRFIYLSKLMQPTIYVFIKTLNNSRFGYSLSLYVID